MEEDKCTIIIPMYNSELTIDNCIKSVVNQSYDNLEIIIVNDGSTDGSEKKCIELCRKDKRIKLFNQINMGVSSARNYGVKKATGKFICFVDSDDTIEKDMIKVLHENMVDYDCDLSACNINIIKHGKTKFVSNHLNNDLLLLRKRIDFYNKKYIFKGYLCNKMFKSEILKKLKLYDNIHYCEDEILLIDYAELSNKFVYCDIPLYNYYIHDSGASSWTTWNDKKITILDAKKICIEKLNKYGNEIVKDYYLDYFFALNDISKRFDKSIEKKQECGMLYKNLIKSRSYTFKQKIFVFAKYRLYFLYYLLKSLY